MKIARKDISSQQAVVPGVLYGLLPQVTSRASGVAQV